MNSSNCSPVQQFVIEIRGSHVPSFKNNKELGWRKTKRGKTIPTIRTNSRYRRWMDQAIRSIESQLRSWYQTADEGTGTEQSLRSWIVSSVPLDDSLDWIPESGGWRTIRVPKGEEGIRITVEKIS